MLTFEPLECRTVLSAVLVDAFEAIREVDADVVRTGPNAGFWIARFDGYEGYGPSQLEQVQRDLAESGSSVSATRWLGADGLFELQGDPENAASEVAGGLKSVGGFVSVEQDYFFRLTATPNDTNYANGKQPDMAKINAPAAWDINVGINPATGAVRNVVAVIDSGIDYNHPDLSANMWRNPGEIAGDGKDNDLNGYADDYYGYDFLNTDSDPMDDRTNSHGTHVAGTIGAVGNNA